MIGLHSSQTSLLLCGPDGALDQNIVGVNSALLDAPEPAILCAHPDDPLSRSEAVQVHGFAEIPPGVLAIGQELAARLDLDQHEATWRLDVNTFTRQKAKVLELELTVDAPVVAAMAQALSAQASLAGRLLYVSASQQVGALALAVAGEDYRVRRVDPEPAPGRVTLYELDSSTEVQLFSSGTRTPVDVVVLADSSRSMGVPDLEGMRGPEASVSSSKPATTRLDGAKRALDHLLKERMAAPGRLARFALVSFANDCKLVFPTVGGMAELDENTPQQTRIELAEAIARLQPKGDTDLGSALKFAGELLAKHSAPGNDRLIVLISDGAHSADDRGDDEYRDDRDDGAMLKGIAEPRSLVESLSAQLGVRVHSIGISSPEGFNSFLRRMQSAKGYASPAHQSWCPNDELLRALMQVSGGDPERVGSSLVSLEYFAQLGAGVSYRVNVGQPPPPPQLTPAELSCLEQYQAQVGKTQRARQREELARDIQSEWRKCNDIAEALIDWPLLYKEDLVNNTLNGDLLWKTDVLSRNDFRSWWLDMHQVFHESQHPYSFKIPGVRQILKSEQTSDIWQLRNWMSHNQNLPDRKREREKSQKALHKFVGVCELADGDSDNWSRLQLALLTELRELGRTLAACLAASAQAKAAGTYRHVIPELPASEEPAQKPTGPRLLLISAPPLRTQRLHALQSSAETLDA
jgi:hypothetical protein